MVKMDQRQTAMTETEPESPKPPPTKATGEDSEVQEAQLRLTRARQRLLAAAVAFCDGLISAGQLRAVGEMLKEQELRLTKLTGEAPPPFLEPAPASAPSPAVPAEPMETEAEVEAGMDDEAFSLPPRPKPADMPADPELESVLVHLDTKISQLEQDYQQGRINASQYRAIRRHYLEQHEVALRLHQANPKSDRWKVVLEEGKTAFLMQLNEAECRCIAFFDIADRQLIYVQGKLPEAAEEAMRFLSTFGHKPGEPPSGRMFATQTEEGDSLLLIPGRFTATLVVFSDEPPGWQVRALREVQRNFEAANQAALDRGERRSLVFPNLERFFRNNR